MALPRPTHVYQEGAAVEPGRAARCALALGEASKQIGLPLSSGLHTGEIEIRDREIGDIAVHAAALRLGKYLEKLLWLTIDCHHGLLLK
jgi:hypothetical protein